MYQPQSPEFLYRIIFFLMILIFLMMLFGPIARAYEEATVYPMSLDDQTDILYYQTGEDSSLSKIRTHLRENDWVKPYVDDEELDYILLLVRHLSTQYDNIDPNLVTAMIAVESRFDTNAKNDGARGLMQLIPAYNEHILVSFIEEDEKYTRDLFYDQRLNIMTGMQYISYILGEVEGDLNYALMWYNQGAVSACDMYEYRGVVSNYAKTVQRLAKELSSISET